MQHGLDIIFREGQSASWVTFQHEHLAHQKKTCISTSLTTSSDIKQVNPTLSLNFAFSVLSLHTQFLSYPPPAHFPPSAQALPVRQPLDYSLITTKVNILHPPRSR